MQKYEKSLYQISIFCSDEVDKVVGGKVDLVTDLAGTEVDLVTEGGAFFYKGGEGLLHADRGATSMDVACERLQIGIYKQLLEPYL